MADIFGVRVTADLNILDSFIVISNSSSGQTEPAVTFADQNYFVAWLDPASQTRNASVNVARVDTQGIVLDNGVFLGAGDRHPDIAFDGDRCLVVWSEELHGVMGRYVNAACLPEGPPIEITLTQGSSTQPVVEFGTPNYLVVWADFCSTGISLDVFGQLLSPYGQLIGDRILIADGGSVQDHPTLAFDGNDFMVVWVEDANKIYGRYLAASGTPVGDKFLISNNTPYERQYPSVAAGTDNYLIAWSEYRDDFDVYGNLDVAVGVAEIAASLPVKGSAMLWSQLQKYITTDHGLYDILGRRISTGQVAPGVYFLETEERILQKIIVIH